MAAAASGWSSPADASSPARVAAVPLIRRSPVTGLYWNTSPRAGDPGKLPEYQSDRKLPVRRARQPDRGGVGIADGPADVVVAADVGDPGAGRRFRPAARPRAVAASVTSPVASIDQICTIRLLW